MHIAGAEVVVQSDSIISIYPDGAVSRFYPPVDDAKFRSCAQLFGYTSAMQYGLEHDLGHHLVADALGWLHSKVIWCEAHGRDWTLYPKDERWHEEHVCNRMLRYINTGEKDEDFGVLADLFGDRLPEVAGKIHRTLRPWLV